MDQALNILLAEDDSISLRILESTLASWGYAVTSASNGKEAWNVLNQTDAPCLAILDVNMPEMNGLEVCRRVRQLKAPTPPYLILLTGASGKQDVVNGIEAGANDYLTKPFHREELRVRIWVGAQMIGVQRALAERVQELEDALAQVKQLQGMLPICSYCKQVRDDQNYWHKVENYISSHAGIKFSHGICPDCYVQVLQEIEGIRSAVAPTDT